MYKKHDTSAMESDVCMSGRMSDKSLLYQILESQLLDALDASAADDSREMISTSSGISNAEQQRLSGQPQ